MTETYFAVHRGNGQWFSNHPYPAVDFTGSTSYTAALIAARQARDEAGEGAVIYRIRKDVVE